ncbi:MAG: hypothetical protein ABJK59_12710 [Erythrobacter sp.]|uniref:hypothetical protein n=1 Tax=Erythrobacter sp. TaxID=1042 RepID=UPI003298991D
MISVIVYGRNDNYSYALDRRTALGLNQMARQLEVGRDEIIFVDYNTDNDLPTYPEAIGDTLTNEAVQLIRVIRVRPEIHEAASPDGPPVREAFCRNVALRRVSGQSEWVLSTNPDCLLISPSGARLSNQVAGLPTGYFGLPRFELPRIVWETLPRSAPEDAAKLALKYAGAFALEETVRHYLPAIGYDGPGDFQLVRTSDLQAICGFNEEMTRGWHVDSNLNARLALLHGALSNFNEATGSDLALYHTEHSRRISAKHQSGRAEDPFDVYVDQVTKTVPKGQQSNWGAKGQDFEEFRLANPPGRSAIFDLAQICDQPVPVSYIYGPESFDALPQTPDEHLSAFLVDHLAYLKPGTKVGWLCDDEHLSAQVHVWVKAAGLDLKILDLDAERDYAAIIEQADVVCFAPPNGPASDDNAFYDRALAQLILSEDERIASGAAPRRVVGLNIPHTRFEETFTTFIASALTPVSSRIRFGEVKPSESGPIDLSDSFEPGPSGKVEGGKIVSKLGDEGYMAMVRRPIQPGKWRVDFTIHKTVFGAGRIIMDVVLDTQRVAHAAISKLSFSGASGSIEFESGLDGMFGGYFECRLWVDGTKSVILQNVTLTRV